MASARFLAYALCFFQRINVTKQLQIHIEPCSLQLFRNCGKVAPQTPTKHRHTAKSTGFSAARLLVGGLRLGTSPRSAWGAFACRRGTCPAQKSDRPEGRPLNERACFACLQPKPFASANEAACAGRGPIPRVRSHIAANDYSEKSLQGNSPQATVAKITERSPSDH